MFIITASCRNSRDQLAEHVTPWLQSAFQFKERELAAGFDAKEWDFVGIHSEVQAELDKLELHAESGTLLLLTCQVCKCSFSTIQRNKREKSKLCCPHES